MARKAKSGKPLTANEMVGILSDNIRNLKNGTADVKEVNATTASVRTICQVVKTQMAVASFSVENRDTPLALN